MSATAVFRSPVVPRPSAGDGDVAIRTERLTKRYGARAVVDGLSISVPRGSVVGFVGPNGAGKTTTMRMLLGLIGPSEGSATVLGRPLSEPLAYLPRVGAMIEGPAFHPTLSGRRNLEVLAHLARLPRARVGEVLQIADLSSRAGDPYRSYSLGMKQRLGIAAALLADPELLLLDEPTNGLDPAGILELRALLAGLAAEGRTVLVSSHLLAEVETIADWLVLLKEGRLVYDGSIGGALAATRSVIVVRAEGLAGLAEVEAIAREAGHEVSREDGALLVGAPSGYAGPLNRAAIGAGVVLTELTPRTPSLEEAFLSLLEDAR